MGIEISNPSRLMYGMRIEISIPYLQYFKFGIEISIPYLHGSRVREDFILIIGIHLTLTVRKKK